MITPKDPSIIVVVYSCQSQLCKSYWHSWPLSMLVIYHWIW